jgi:protein ImuB
MVTVAKVKNAMMLQAVDRHATTLGLRVGQPLANARAMLPALEVMQEDATADATLLGRIADWCDGFTPYVAMDGKSRLLLDVTGATHLFGGEQAMLALICKKLERQNFAVRAAMAGTAAAARALCRYRHGTIIASGAEAEAIRPLPVEALGLDHVTTHALRRAGLKTVGAVATRKRSEIAARFGAATQSLIDDVLGPEAKPISPRLARPEYTTEQAFPEPIATDTLISATLHELCGRLATMMQKTGMGARQLQAQFFRADGAVRAIGVSLGMATREAQIIMRLFREKLDVLNDPLDPGFGFDVIRLSATRVEAFHHEVVDLDVDLAAQQEIGFLIDRLATRFGATRILRFQPGNTHIPEKSFFTSSAQGAMHHTHVWKRHRQNMEIPLRPLRLFMRAELVAKANEGSFIWRRAARTVRQSQGPERIAPEWWLDNAQEATRDYRRMEDETGRRYWLYQNLSTHQWFMHGLFA